MSFNAPLMSSDLLPRKHKHWLTQISRLSLEQQNQWKLLDIIWSPFINNKNSLAAVANEAMHV